jgi:pimeloyl-ACP methyl ester carboxylesterase
MVETSATAAARLAIEVRFAAGPRQASAAQDEASASSPLPMSSPLRPSRKGWSTSRTSEPGLPVLAAELARLLPNAQTVDIRGASHVMHLDDPKATVQGIDDFMDSDGAPG